MKDTKDLSLLASATNKTEKHSKYLSSETENLSIKIIVQTSKRHKHFSGDFSIGNFLRVIDWA